MQDILKILIERVLSWPIAALILCLVFRKSLTSLIDRVDLFKGPGIEVSTPLISATKQLDSEALPKTSDLTLPVPEQQPLGLPDNIEEQRRAALTYGGEEEVLLLQMRAIQENLEYLRFPLGSEETARVLIRHLAASQLLYKAEVLYRLIFGSQIALMRELNESGAQAESFVRVFYDRAKAESPMFYSDYTFENWINFLLTQQAVAFESNRYGISKFGHQFLGWLVANSVPAKLY